MKRKLVTIVAGLALAALAPAAAQAAQSLVTAGPSTPFPQNKQNEPAVAVDPNNPSSVAAGSNDEIDLAPCDGNSCPFTPGVGVSGIYFSTDGGGSWTQPTYAGYGARDGSPDPGSPIGTLPNYYEHGLASDGDPGVAFGPRRGSDGVFRWSNGSRLYYSNLAANLATVRKDFTFKGFEAIAVSYTDDVASAAAGNAGAWSDPRLVTSEQQSSATFSDKPSIAVDNAATSPRFGTVYVCYSRFQSAGSEPDAIFVTRSTDGGDHWVKPVRLTAYFNSPGAGGRQGCQVGTDSNGALYVVWEDAVKHQSVFKMSRSFDGGTTFEKPFVVANVADVGVFDSVRSISFDGIAGARTSSFPSLSIANGAPSGQSAPNTIALGWSDGADGLNSEHALVRLSNDGGKHWSGPTAVEETGDRPDFAFLGISPDGSDLYVAYDGFTDPFRDNTTASRNFAPVLRHADVSGTSVSNVTTAARGSAGDGRASSANALIDEFLGDYNTVAATNDGAVAVLNDASSAAVCPAINTFRQGIVDGTASLSDAPAPATDCPATFGNTNIIADKVADPS